MSKMTVILCDCDCMLQLHVPNFILELSYYFHLYLARTIVATVSFEYRYRVQARVIKLQSFFSLSSRSIVVKFKTFRISEGETTATAGQ